MQDLCHIAHKEALAQKLTIVLTAMDSARECKDKEVYKKLYRTKQKIVAQLD